MNKKEFINELSIQANLPAKEAAACANALVASLSAHLAEEDTIAISGFGQFEVKRKMERVIVNPSTKQRMLVPPTIVVGFKPVQTLKERVNQKNAKE